MNRYNQAIIQVKAISSDQLQRHIDSIMNGGADHVVEINSTPVEKWVEIAAQELEERNWWRKSKQNRKRRKWYGIRRKQG